MYIDKYRYGITFDKGTDKGKDKDKDNDNDKDKDKGAEKTQHVLYFLKGNDSRISNMMMAGAGGVLFRCNSLWQSMLARQNQEQITKSPP